MPVKGIVQHQTKVKKMNYGALPLSDDGDERGELLGGGGGDQKKCVVALSWCRVFHNCDQFLAQLQDDVAKGTKLNPDEREAMNKASEFGADYFLPFDNPAIFRVLNEYFITGKGYE